MIRKEDLSEFVGQIIDLFEVFLEKRHISLKNDEREDDPDAAMIYGTDYGELQTGIEDILLEWKLTTGYESGTTESWAEREVDLACKKERRAAEENPDSQSDIDWDYGCKCYKSALNAFRCLCADAHSGMSIRFTKAILNRLIDLKPLTPIEDTEDMWNLTYTDVEGSDHYQSKRMSSLFKIVGKDGSISYDNVDLFIGIDIHNEDSAFHNKLIDTIMSEKFPITMPYMPERSIRVYCEDCLFDRNNGDYDTIAILYAINNDERIEINRYFKESENDWEEISAEEYYERKKIGEVNKTN